ncbi:MAG: PBECR2 nuclease fold domain-containing protein [Pseudomonadales bacterium]|nr:PBECR2 nuclease fold domain-containing protein [Pseudomonadales bacterium]
MSAATQARRLPFKEQIDFFRSKVPIPTQAWTDIQGREHDHVFMVAGANRMAIVEDFQAAIGGFIENGSTIEDFRKEFDAIVERNGWPFKGGRNWRTRVIYETNLRQSYHAGREAQIADPELRKARPFGLYRHGGSSDPRPEHLALDGTVLPLDDPWWDIWSPQNGWGCSCKKFTLSQADVERLGLTVREKAPAIQWEDRTIGIRGPSPQTIRVPKGVDPGFEFRPGASRIRGDAPPQLDEPLRGLPGRVFPPRRASDSLPRARRFAESDLMPQGLSDEQYVRGFLSEFGADLGKPALLTDQVGEPLLISEALFLKQTGEWKVQKRGRERFMKLLARTVKSPDEIWVAAEWHGASSKPVLRRRYIAHYRIPGRDQPGIAVFEWGRNGWAGVTTFQETDDAVVAVEDFRKGVRLYRRTGR